MLCLERFQTLFKWETSDKVMNFRPSHCISSFNLYIVTLVIFLSFLQMNGYGSEIPYELPLRVGGFEQQIHLVPKVQRDSSVPGANRAVPHPHQLPGRGQLVEL